jgi:hypothetical protein
MLIFEKNEQMIYSGPDTGKQIKKELTAPPMASKVQYNETIGDLAYEVSLPRAQFGLNDEIEVYSKVTNLGKDMLTNVKGSSSCPIHVNVQIVNQESMKSLAFKAVDQACTADQAKSRLEPAQILH